MFSDPKTLVLVSLFFVALLNSIPSVSYELLAGINYCQIIGTHIRDNIHINPMDFGKFHVTYYKHVTKGCVSNDIATN